MRRRQTVRRRTDQVVEALFVAAETRVCLRLLELRSVDGTDDGAAIGLTEEQPAMPAGTSRPTVNRVLADLSQQGIVTIRRGGVDVCDRHRLASRCRAD